MKLPLTILGGYLGAGKTTLVNHLLRHAGGRRIAVLVNEFGSLPIDADLIEAEGDDLIALSGGCVCCSYGDDLMGALVTMASADPAPDHVLLEASGVALPGAIGATVSLIEAIALEAIVVLADAERLPAQAADTYLADTIARQLQSADIVILNKADLVDGDGLAAAEARIAEAALGAKVVTSVEGRVSPSLLDASFSRAPAGPSPVHGAPLSTATLAMEAPVDPAAFAQNLAADPLLLRAKGHLIAASDGALLTLQMVGTRFELTPAPEGARPGIVTISKPLEAQPPA